MQGPLISLSLSLSALPASNKEPSCRKEELPRVDPSWHWQLLRPQLPRVSARCQQKRPRAQVWTLQ